MVERTVNFGSDETDAKYQISDDGTPGNFVLARDTDGSVVLLQWNASTSQWEFGGPVDLDGNDLEDGAVTVYDADTDTVGDGTTSADHASVDTIALSSNIETGTDVSGSRSFDSPEQNTSGRLRHVMVRADATADNASVGLELQVANTTGALDSDAAVDTVERVLATGERVSVEGTVPAGAHYTVLSFGDTADFQMNRWNERNWE